MDVFYRIEIEKSEEILKSLSQHNDMPWIDNILTDIRLPGKVRVLIQTGTTEGDRYYLRSEWNDKNDMVKECLSMLFNKSLLSKRDLKEEEDLMKYRSTRLVYWYSKEWALGIAREIEECGGQASFVNGYV